MVGLGVSLLVAAVLVPKLAVLWGVGALSVFIGLVLAVLGSVVMPLAAAVTTTEP